MQHEVCDAHAVYARYLQYNGCHDVLSRMKKVNMAGSNTSVKGDIEETKENLKQKKLLVCT